MSAVRNTEYARFRARAWKYGVWMKLWATVLAVHHSPMPMRGIEGAERSQAAYANESPTRRASHRE